ncbi:hypothetical protein ACKWTF_008609 [Chironomus riparius]
MIIFSSLHNLFIDNPNQLSSHDYLCASELEEERSLSAHSILFHLFCVHASIIISRIFIVMHDINKARQDVTWKRERKSLKHESFIDIPLSLSLCVIYAC